MKYECFHCGKIAVIWEADFDYEDFGLEGEGLVHTCSCTNCGADIQYFIPSNTEEEEE